MARPKAVKIEEKIVSDEDNGGFEEKTNTVAELAQEPRKRFDGKWVKMTEEEVKAHTKSGKLFGYDPKTKEGLLKERD